MKTAPRTPAGNRYLLRLYGLLLAPGGICQWAAIFIDPTPPVLELVPGCIHRMMIDFVLFHDVSSHLAAVGQYNRRRQWLHGTGHQGYGLRYGASDWLVFAVWFDISLVEISCLICIDPDRI